MKTYPLSFIPYKFRAYDSTTVYLLLTISLNALDGTDGIDKVSSNVRRKKVSFLEQKPIG